MRQGPGILILFGVCIAIVIIAIIFIPLIFGSAEPEMNLTNNSSMAIYNMTTVAVMNYRSLLWVVGILLGMFMLVGILIWRGRR
jgi:hypothetical protein